MWFALVYRCGRTCNSNSSMYSAAEAAEAAADSAIRSHRQTDKSDVPFVKHSETRGQFRASVVLGHLAADARPAVPPLPPSVSAAQDLTVRSSAGSHSGELKSMRPDSRVSVPSPNRRPSGGAGGRKGSGICRRGRRGARWASVSLYAWAWKRQEHSEVRLNRPCSSSAAEQSGSSRLPDHAQAQRGSIPGTALMERTVKA